MCKLSQYLIFFLTRQVSASLLLLIRPWPSLRRYRPTAPPLSAVSIKKLPNPGSQSVPEPALSPITRKDTLQPATDSQHLN